MSSNDPHLRLPNLTGSEPASTYENIRSSDPSRFFPSAHKGNIDAVTGRILATPRLTLVRSAAHNIANGGVFVPIQWDKREVDTDGMWGGAANSTQIKCITPGRWNIRASVLWPLDTTSFREMLLQINGIFQFGDVIPPPTSVTVGHQKMDMQVDLNAGDIMILGLAQNTVTNPLTLPANNTVSLHDHCFQAVLVSTFGSDN